MERGGLLVLVAMLVRKGFGRTCSLYSLGMHLITNVAHYARWTWLFRISSPLSSFRAMYCS